jgi:flagellar basal body-associated protein FliL
VVVVVRVLVVVVLVVVVVVFFFSSQKHVGKETVSQESDMNRKTWCLVFLVY